MKDDDICEVKCCRSTGHLLYYGHEVCKKHWHRHCDGSDDFKLESELGMPPAEEYDGLLLDQAKVFLEMGSDVLLTILFDAPVKVVLQAAEYDEDTIDQRVHELVAGGHGFTLEKE